MKTRTSFVCQQCGYETPQWYGKCPSCGAWSSMVETAREEQKSHGSSFVAHGKIRAKSQKLSHVKHIEKNRVKSGFGEFDRVMGGGIVPGSVTLLAGDPGIGKSTLLLHVLHKTGGLYVSGEESAEQIKLRAKRLGIEGNNISVLSEINAETIVEIIRQEDNTAGRTTSYGQASLTALPSYRLIIIDSIQTLSSSDLDGMAGSVGQIRRSAEILIAAAKSSHMPVIIIGHVTKEGAIAGPKVLEHMVDTVLYLEGDRYANARILRTFKNRFGATEEVGIFEMNEKGLSEVPNPSALFLQDRVTNVPGSVVTVIMEGTRPILVEIQALAVSTQLAMPKRVANGIDYNRLQLIVAILQKRLSLPLSGFDVFVNVSGGLKIAEPAADLAVATAILSSCSNKSVDPRVAVFGELGLLGEVRAVGSIDRRIKEAKRLGFASVIAPPNVRSLKQVAQLLR